MCQNIFKRILFLMNFILGLYFSLVSHKLNRSNGLPLLERPKCVHWWVSFIIVGLIQADMAEFGQLRLRIPVYFWCTYVWNMIYFRFHHCLLLVVPNMHDTQRVTSYIRSRKRFVMTLRFADINMDLGHKRDNLSFQDFNYYWKRDGTYGNIIFSTCSCVRFFDLLI